MNPESSDAGVDLGRDQLDRKYSPRLQAKLYLDVTPWKAQGAARQHLFCVDKADLTTIFCENRSIG
jgi:hypothetical protein